jgi:large subunit ribosomal protein L21
MFAVIKSGGRQYKVSVGQTLEVNRLPVEDGKQISIAEVLLISDADRSLLGAPFVENAEVLATVNGQKRGKKVIIFKYKSKKRYRHRRGHRQELTVLTIDDIVTDGKSLVTGEAPQVRETPVEDEAPAVEASETTATEEQAAPAEAAEGKKTTRRRRTAKAAEAESSTEE